MSRTYTDTSDHSGWIQSRLAYAAGRRPVVPNHIRVAHGPAGYVAECWKDYTLVGVGPARTTRDAAAKDLNRLDRKHFGVSL